MARVVAWAWLFHKRPDSIAALEIASRCVALGVVGVAMRVMLRPVRPVRYDRAMEAATKILGNASQPAELFGAANSARSVEAARIVEQYAAAYLDTRAWNAAYRRCHDCAGMTAATVNANAAALANYPGVRARVRALLSEAAERAIVTVAEVLERNMMIATANPNKIVRTVRFPCRCCWGFNGDYQWRNEAEHTAAVAAELDAAATERRVPKIPSDMGGFGYSLHGRPVNPDCEQCGGLGDARVSIADTSLLEGAELMLYKGAKQDRFGAITIELHDQSAALDRVARILGAYKDSLLVKPGTPTPTELPSDTPRERVADAYLELIR